MALPDFKANVFIKNLKSNDNSHYLIILLKKKYANDFFHKLTPFLIIHLTKNNTIHSFKKHFHPLKSIFHSF